MHRPTFRKLSTTTVIAVVLSLALAACVGGGDDAAMTTFGGAAEDRSPTTTVATPPPSPGSERGSVEGPGEGEDALGGAGAVEAILTAADLGRSIIFTADITVEVDDVVAAGRQAQTAVAGLGGILFGQETRTGPEAVSVLTIKVPPENFGAALERLAGIGELRSQTVFADDVTERVVDLESQITTAEASVARLRGFLESATDLEDLAVLEAELLRRETDLEVLRGRLRTLDDQVALATIVVSLVEPSAPTPEPALELIQTAYASHDGGQSCPGAESITIDEGDSMTVCYQLTNTGDTALTDIELRDRGLDARAKDLIVVEGELDEPLLPNERLILAFEADAEPAMFVGPDISIQAVDTDGDPLRTQVEVERELVELRIEEDTSLPGFTDSLESAFGALLRVLGVAVVIAGTAIPFLWVPVLVIGVVWFLDRRRSASDDDVETPETPETADTPGLEGI